MSGSFAGTEFLCGPEAQCADGFRCIEGSCFECPDAECTLRPTCGDLASLQDDFDDDQIDGERWVPFGVGEDLSVNARSGRLRFEVGVLPTLAGVTLGSVEDFAMPSSLAIEVLLTDVGEASTFLFQLRSMGNTGAYIAVEPGMLSVRYQQDVLFEQAWDRLRYWLRYESRGDQLAAQWSDDGILYQDLYVLPFDEERVFVNLTLLSNGGEARTVVAELDNVGLPPGVEKVGCE